MSEDENEKKKPAEPDNNEADDASPPSDPAELPTRGSEDRPCVPNDSTVNPAESKKDSQDHCADPTQSDMGSGATDPPNSSSGDCDPQDLDKPPTTKVNSTLMDDGSGQYDQLFPDESLEGYRIIQKLGEGGFGEVYHARQTEPVRRDVAIKVIKKGMDTKEVLSRFHAERQALAMMNHPGIAKVFDAGTTATGQPFFVMELVKGVPITRFCDLNKFTVRQRVDLFVEVCHAIQHAHHKGVIHRDIKPSNIIVTGSGDRPLPIVIDFGVAKATQQQLGQESVVTKLHQVIGTPAYMSPEQAESTGMDIDTRADVYSLGVVLYELLCGSLPLGRDWLRTKSNEKIAQTLREKEPDRPSQKLHPAKESKRETYATARQETPTSLCKLLRNELDWIAMKCLEKDRTKRYATVSGLAADCNRFLENEPVQAKRSTLVYSLQKFAAKNRAVVLSTLAFIFLLSGGLIVSGTAASTFWSQKQDLLRLSDKNILEGLRNDFEGLFATENPNRKQAITDWLEGMKDVLERETEHRTTLQRLEDQRKGQFSDERLEWQYQSQLALVNLLDHLGRGTNGKFKIVSSLLERTPSPEEVEASWKTCKQELEEQHPNWIVEVNSQLFPLGKNAISGLWEFVDLRTGLGPPKVDKRPDQYTGVIYVLLPGGKFTMGSPEDEPGRKKFEVQHEVELSAFLIAKYEVTQAIWLHRMKYRDETAFEDPTKPTPASWFDARKFSLPIDAELPTEAQWEYACRAGTQTRFAGNGELENMGWYAANSNQCLHSVGLKSPNQFGLYDMHGNASEWVFDLYEEDFYTRSDATRMDPRVEPKLWTFEEFCQLQNNLANATTEERVAALDRHRACVRGGLAIGRLSYCRSANRFAVVQNVNLSMMGFRPVVNGVVKVKKKLQGETGFDSIGAK